MKLKELENRIENLEDQAEDMQYFVDQIADAVQDFADNIADIQDEMHEEEEEVSTSYPPDEWYLPAHVPFIRPQTPYWRILEHSQAGDSTA